jgi:transcriptional repressor NrdR
MRCPYCLNEETSVAESRSMMGEVGVRRRRVCNKCKKRFTTYERVGNLDLKVLKRDGRHEAFSREKLEKGIAKACWKRNVSENEVLRLIDGIEAKLLGRKSITIKSSDKKLVLELEDKNDYQLNQKQNERQLNGVQQP